jgi:putative flavoprotein involved in K+ transport
MQSKFAAPLFLCFGYHTTSLSDTINVFPSPASKKRMSKHIGTAIIGAGPYGLSLAAHLHGRKSDFCIFGRPMATWRTQMPFNMCLKSEGFASNLSEPSGKFTLKEFCRLNGIEYADIGIPVRLETFSSYGLAFQRKFVPTLDERHVTHIVRDGEEFRLTLQDGVEIWARQVVVAAGISHFGSMPEVLANMPPEFVSHGSRYHRLDQFKDRDVIVIGGGASAVDVALSLHDAGVRPRLVARGKDVHFHGKSPDKRSLFLKIKSPWSGIGPSWRSRMACDLPLIFHVMPKEFRIRIAKKHLGPAPGWFTRDRMFQHVPMICGLTTVAATVEGSKVHLQLRDRDGALHEMAADHVIACTGYRVDLKRLDFLDESLLQQIDTEEDSPKLSSRFESTVPGLYFVGTTAAYSFGPLLRFAFGARFVARRLSSYLS